MCAVDEQSRQGRNRLPTRRSALWIEPSLSNVYPAKKMIKPESLVVYPEFFAVISVEAAHMLKLLKRALDVKGNADFLGPFTPCRLIECFATLDAAAWKFGHVGRARFS